jgi:hypothetical protein
MWGSSGLSGEFCELRFPCADSGSHFVQEPVTLVYADDAAEASRDVVCVRNGVTKMIAFLADIAIDAVNALAVMMDEKDVPSIDLF